MFRFNVHIYCILSRKGWHFSCNFDDINHLLLFFKHHVPLCIDYPSKTRLYRVYDSYDNKYTFFMVTFNKYHNNKIVIIDRDVAEDYINGL